jgi:hypothetical protein
VNPVPPRDILSFPPHRSAGSEPELRYSFKYLDTSDPRFRIADRDGGYFRVLLARLKDLSTLRLSEFRGSRSGTLRIHRIDFRDQRVAARGFGIPGGESFDRYGWQFSLSANEHGRVHGFLVEDTFYIRWLDPDHNLYPG